LGGSPYFWFYCVFINKCFEIGLRGVLYLPSSHPPLCASMNSCSRYLDCQDQLFVTVTIFLTVETFSTVNLLFPGVKNETLDRDHVETNLDPPRLRSTTYFLINLIIFNEVIFDEVINPVSLTLTKLSFCQ
jgi:hypothetical protein